MAVRVARARGRPHCYGYYSWYCSSCYCSVVCATYDRGGDSALDGHRLRHCCSCVGSMGGGRVSVAVSPSVVAVLVSTVVVVAYSAVVVVAAHTGVAVVAVVLAFAAAGVACASASPCTQGIRGRGGRQSSGGAEAVVEVLVVVAGTVVTVAARVVCCCMLALLGLR